MIKECIKNKESPPNKPVMPYSLNQGSTGSTVEGIYWNLFFGAPCHLAVENKR